MGLSHVSIPRKMEQGLSSQGRQLPGWAVAKFWVGCFGEQRICVQLVKKETVLEISLDEEVKKKLVALNQNLWCCSHESSELKRNFKP